MSYEYHSVYSVYADEIEQFVELLDEYSTVGLTAENVEIHNSQPKARQGVTDELLEHADHLEDRGTWCVYLKNKPIREQVIVKNFSTTCFYVEVPRKINILRTPVYLVAVNAEIA